MLKMFPGLQSSNAQKLLSIIEFVTLVHSLKSIYKDAFKYRIARKAIYIFSVNRIAATMTIYYIPLGEFASECGKDFSEGSFILKCGGLYKESIIMRDGYFVATFKANNSPI